MILSVRRARGVGVYDITRWKRAWRRLYCIIVLKPHTEITIEGCIHSRQNTSYQDNYIRIIIL